MTLLQIQISPNTPIDPQILGFSKFYSYLVQPNLGALVKETVRSNRQ